MRFRENVPILKIRNYDRLRQIEGGHGTRLPCRWNLKAGDVINYRFESQLGMAQVKKIKLIFRKKENKIKKERRHVLEILF